MGGLSVLQPLVIPAKAGISCRQAGLCCTRSRIKSGTPIERHRR
jgi:hypothetical protein